MAEPPFWLITGKHSKGRRVRLGDKPAAARSFQRGCPAERTAPLRFPGAVLAEAIPTEKDADRTSLAVAGRGLRLHAPNAGGAGSNPGGEIPACPAAKKRMQTIWGEISQESHFPPWHTPQYCCATLRSFEKIPQRVRGPWPQKWAPPAGDGARWAHCRGGPQQRARGRRQRPREREPFVFLLLGMRY